MAKLMYASAACMWAVSRKSPWASGFGEAHQLQKLASGYSLSVGGYDSAIERFERRAKGVSSVHVVGRIDAGCVFVLAPLTKALPADASMAYRGRTTLAGQASVTAVYFGQKTLALQEPGMA